MKQRILRDCKISIFAPHPRSRFAWARMFRADGWWVKTFERDLIKKCPACGGVEFQSDDFPAHVFAVYHDTFSTSALAIMHAACFESLPTITPELEGKLRKNYKILEARAAAEFRARYPKLRWARF